VAASHEQLQLRATASALREALEFARAEKEKSVQAAVSSAHAEIQQLKSTVSALREKLETKRPRK
jgi:hypothetical protein